MEYLKPNFSRHWGNWVLAPLVAFFLGFLPASAFADGTYYYYDNDSAQAACLAKQASEIAAGRNVNACTWTSGHWLLTSYIGAYWQNNDRQRYRYYPTAGCPGQVSDPNGMCVDPVPCPDSGTVFAGTFAREPQTGIWETTVGGVRNVDGCEVTPVFEAVKCFWADELDPNNPETVCRSIHHYEYTGNDAPGGTGAPGSDPEDLPVPTGEPLAPADHTKDLSTSTPIPESVEVLPDGTVITQSGYVETQTKNIGPNIQQDTETTVIDRSDGITKTTTVTTTTTTNPDGSKSVVEATTTAYEQTDKELIMVKGQDGTITITSVPGYSGSTTTTKTTGYDTQGNSTGTQTNTSHGADGNGDAAGEQDKGDYCEENPVALECESISASGKDSEGTNSWWESSYPDGLQGIWDSHTSGLGDMVGGTGIADIGITSTSTDPAGFCMTFDVMQGHNLGSHCAAVASYVWNFIALCLMITALFSARRLVFGG